MARVVHRRPGPPYLLILFVFLFLVSTTLAVLFYTKKEEATKKKAEAEDKAAKLASPQAQRAGLVADRLRDKAAPNENAEQQTETVLTSDADAKRAREQSVVAYLTERMMQLARGVLSAQGSAAAGEDAKASFLSAARELQEARDAVAKWHGEPVVGAAGAPTTAPAAGNWGGVLPELKSAYEKFVAQRDIASTLLNELNASRKNAEAMQAQLADTTTQLTAKTSECQAAQNALASANSEVTSLKGELAAAQKTAKDRGDQLDANAAEITKAQKEITTRTAEIDTLNKEVQKLRTERKIQDIRDKLAIKARPDGKVFKLVSNQNLCYIDRGIRDNISAGMTFAVYPKTGLPDNMVSKGQLTVVRADDASSLCRITSQSDLDPVSVDDLIANVVYNTQRKYTFVVEGTFDLSGSNDPTVLGRREVVMLIQKFGGVVADQVDVNVDYVVLGDAPKMPEAPTEASGPERDRYEQNKSAYEKYQKAKTETVRLGVPILNTNRFLDLVGYTPVKTHQY